MTIIISFVIFIALLVLAAGIVFAVYMQVYKRRLNAALVNSSSGGQYSSKGRKMLPPWVLLILLAGAVPILVIIAGAVSYTAQTEHYGTFAGGVSENGTDEGGNYGFPDVRFSLFAAESLQGTFLGEYEAGGELPGYSRSTAEDGDFRFTCYTQNTGGGFFPDLMIYAEYIGSEPINIVCADADVDNTGWNGMTYQFEGYAAEDTAVWCRFTDLISDGSVTLTLYTGGDPEDPGAERGTLTLDLNEVFSNADNADSSSSEAD